MTLREKKKKKNCLAIDNCHLGYPCHKYSFKNWKGKRPEKVCDCQSSSLGGGQGEGAEKKRESKYVVFMCAIHCVCLPSKQEWQKGPDTQMLGG